MNNASYPIRVVVQRTGLRADLIRMWERRYQAVLPQRGSTGHRLYSDADIERLGLLREAVSCGWRIGEVSGRTDDALRTMIAKHLKAKTPIGRQNTPALPNGGGDTDYLERSLEAIDKMDSVALERVLSEAEMDYGLLKFLDGLITSLAREIGRRWGDGRVRVGQEHLVSATLRHYLDNVRARGNMGGNGPTLLVTTPVGQNHELGALMTAATAASSGWRTTYMNPNTPATEIAWVAKEVDAKAVALSIVYPCDDPRLYGEIHSLRHLLPTETALLIGGAAADSYSSLLAEGAGIDFLDSQKSLQERLALIRLRGSGDTS